MGKATATPRYGNHAGVLVVARETALRPGKPLLLGLRGKNLHAPLTWGSWGGRMEAGESPADAAAREFREETGFAGGLALVPGSEWEHRVKVLGLVHLYTFHNFLGTVESQFVPSVAMPNYETEDARWMSPEEVEALPGPGLFFRGRPGSIHFGLRLYLGQGHVRGLLSRLCDPAGSDRPDSQ
jgi:8-oxo-dGTP pyrophosphatase MutT (NUDIX family)